MLRFGLNSPDMRGLAGALLIVLPVLGGCAHNPGMQQVEHQLARGDTDAALTLAERTIQAGRDEALLALHRGMILRIAGEYEQSIEAFAAAMDIMGELEATSLSEVAAGLAVSEQIGAYNGALHERILLHVYQALNYLESDQPDAALVEARRIDFGLRRIDNRFGREPHGGDAFARFLAGLIYERHGEYSDARISLRKALAVYDAYPDDQPAPRELLRRLVLLSERDGLGDEAREYRQRLAEQPRPLPAEHGEVFIILHNGLAPALESYSLTVQDFTTGYYYRIALPGLRLRRGAATRAVASSDNHRATSEPVENIESIARRDLDAALPGLQARAIARNVARHQASRAVSEESETLALLLNFFATAAEQADTRNWRTLPASLHLLRLPLPAGTYDIEVELRGTGGVSPQQRVLDNVEIRPGEMRFHSLHWIPPDFPARRTP